MHAPLRRHDLVRLSRAGWLHLLERADEGPVRECIAHWQAQQLPLVVGRQEPGCEELALGLPAPLAWERRKIALRVPRDAVLFHDAFPHAAEAARLLPLALRARWAGLVRALVACDAAPRVHGSYGWQRLTGLRYLVATSDIDLLLAVPDAHAADAAAARLDAFATGVPDSIRATDPQPVARMESGVCLVSQDWPGPRVDGELVFPDGSAVAWREWLQWRRGAVDRILVKRLHGVALEAGVEWLACEQAVAA